MTPGQIFWEEWESHYGTGARRWNDVDQGVKDRHESCAQAVIAAHVSQQDDVIALLAGLVREIVTDPIAADERGVMWVNRAQNALSRVQDAPAKPYPATDIFLVDVVETMAGLLKEVLGQVYQIPGEIFFSSLDWKRRAQNALSRLVDAPDAQTPAVDTPKPDDAVTGLSEDQQAITRECDTVRDMLLDKNRKYGNSALSPARVFSRADSVEQIKVRIDDKLSRLASRQADDDEDVTLDLIGYLILLRVAQR